MVEYNKKSRENQLHIENKMYVNLYKKYNFFLWNGYRTKKRRKIYKKWEPKIAT